MKMTARLLMVGLIAMLYQQNFAAAEEKAPEAKKAPSATENKTQPLTAEEKDKVEAIRNQTVKETNSLRNLNEMNEIIIKSYPYGDKGVVIELSWREGKKSFLFFRGKKYTLTLIDEDGLGEVKRADFIYRDSTDRDNMIEVKRIFRCPFTPADLQSEICSLFKRLNACVKDEAFKSGKKLADQFDLKAFYVKFVKRPVLDKLK